MTRAILPNTSAREQWLLARLTDRDWARVLPLGGGKDADTYTGTDTIVPDDDNDDIAFFTSHQTTATDTPNL